MEKGGKKKAKKLGIIFGSVAVVAIIAVLIVINVIIPLNKYNAAQELLAAGDYSGAAAAFAELGDYKDSAEQHEDAVEQVRQLLANPIAAGRVHTVGLKSDGTVIAVGSNEADNGIVYAVGGNNDGQCDVSDWSDIVSVAAGVSHTVGLKSDGTVVAVGYNYMGQCDVSDWSDIVAVAVGDLHIVGLKSDGTVVAVGGNYDGECDVSDWTDIGKVS